jgi:zinc/manganese transport system substrate-binding protein
MKRYFCLLLVILFTAVTVLTACQAGPGASGTKKNIVVTYSVMGSIVKELVGDKANIAVSIPDGLDPHEWQPSAKDMEILNKADLVIQNGLGLETGMQKAFEAAKTRGVKTFVASDHINVRYIGEEELVPGEEEHHTITGNDEIDEQEHHHEVGSPDPHLWTDPQAMKDIVIALSAELKKSVGLDVSDAAGVLQNRLDSLDLELKNILIYIPENKRQLVTGHESMGYFAQRYDFKLVGAIIPSISTQAGVSAADLANLKKMIEKYRVPVIFTELGTSPAVAKVIGEETGVKVVELATHKLPEDGSYFTLMKNLAQSIAGALD